MAEFAMAILVLIHRILNSGVRVMQRANTSVPKGGDVPSGTTLPSFMDHLAQGKEWRVRWIPIDEIKTAKHVLKLVEAPAYEYWTESRRVILLEVWGGEEGVTSAFKVLGLAVEAKSKATKRLKELVRTVPAWTDVSFPIHLVNSWEHIMSDGAGVISAATAEAMIKRCPDVRKRKVWLRGIKPNEDGVIKFKVMKVRVFTKYGWLKQQMYIIDPNTFHSLYGTYNGVACHAEEWKTEVKLADPNGFFAHCWMEEQTGSPVFADSQTITSMSEWAFPRKQVKVWVTAVFRQTVMAMKRREVPEFLLRMPRETDDGSVMQSTITSQHAMYEQAQAYGFNLLSSASFGQMLTEGLFARALSADLWTPVPWSLRGFIASRTIATKLCGWDVPAGVADDEVYWESRMNCHIFPDNVWEERAARLLDGADFDGDMAAMMVKREKRSKRIIGLFYRNPVGEGERIMLPINMESYEGHLFFTDLIDNEGKKIKIPKIDASKAPDDLFDLDSKVTYIPLPGKPKSTKLQLWNERFAAEMLATEKENPGVGPIANLQMLLTAEGLMLPVRYEFADMVDAAMANGDKIMFKNITDNFLEPGYELLAKHGRSEAFMLGMTNQLIKGFAPPKNRATKDVKAAVRRKGGIYHDFFSEIRDHITTEALRFQEVTKNLSMQLRNETLIDPILGEEGYIANNAINPSPDPWLVRLARGYEAVTDSEGNKLTKDGNFIPYVKKYGKVVPHVFVPGIMQYSESLFEEIRTDNPKVSFADCKGDAFAMRAINKEVSAVRAELNALVVDRVVAVLRAYNPRDRYTILVAMYRYALDTSEGHPFQFGHSDRILWAPGSEGMPTVMDLFAGAMIRGGHIDPPAELSDDLRDLLNATKKRVK